MNRARVVLVAVVASVMCLCSACADEPAHAQARAPKWEHAVLEYAKLRLSRGEQERYRWTTAKGRVQASDGSPIWREVGAKGALKPEGADVMQILDALASQGWEVITATDPTFVLADGTAYAHRYYMRRKG